MGYEGIRSDLRSGNGAYLSTLNDLLGVPTEQKAKTIDQLRMLQSTYPNIMDFADQVATLQNIAPRAPKVAVTIPTGPGVSSGADLENALTHLTRGSAVTAYLRDGDQLTGTFADYDAHRLWIRGASRRSVPLEEILAVSSPVVR